jgi:hypothetical protein
MYNKNYNNLGLDPATVTAAVTTAVKAIKSAITTDNAVMQLRGSIITVFQRHGLTEANWNPLIYQYEIAHADIPNRKFLGNYEEEIERVLLWSVAMFERYFPQKLEAYQYLLKSDTSPALAAERAFTFQVPPNQDPGGQPGGGDFVSNTEASFGGTGMIVVGALIIGGILFFGNKD